MEWWKLWIPFIGTLIVAALNYIQNVKQYKDNIKFQNDIEEKQQEFKEKIFKQEINANIISKSRIEWSKDVRKHSAEYLAMLIRIRFNLMRLISVEKKIIKPSMKFDIKELENTKDNLKDSFKIISDEIVLKSEILLLYFSEKEEHKNIEILLSTPVELNFKIRQRDLDIQTMKRTAEEYEKIVIELRKELRKYLKNEWEVAKKI